uniref:Uncharacterized protein n=1 Tax=Lepeophtheirus salmonis TaxID=72036 RepID=A0A0K2T4G8_LEPSM
MLYQHIPRYSIWRGKKLNLRPSILWILVKSNFTASFLVSFSAYLLRLILPMMNQEVIFTTGSTPPVEGYGLRSLNLFQFM